MDKKERVIVYVDGFNFYYGLKKNCKEFYWLDIVKLFDSYIPRNETSAKHKTKRPKPKILNQDFNPKRNVPKEAHTTSFGTYISTTTKRPPKPT